ncbi:MAG: YkgJ family cysteine cluster protein [Candidatus Desulfofervidaceae bacterium]|nr:YkgJ family cysteine cluster protein [Candidatus Desulfofervidaceae bacterium]MDL1970101.1 YkgJ family cysteine cluster protein [Candidatus Desulfofervidaceae bacterium]
MSEETLTEESKFQFACHKGLSCYTQCCHEVNIWLLPYDVLRMKNALGISSEEFLIKYTLPRKGQKGLPVVLLKMQDDEKKSCPFVTAEGCTIYADRPWPCRAYPVEQTEEDGKYRLIKFPFCQGFEEKREWTVSEWKKDQGLNPYLEMEKAYREVTNSKGWERITLLKGEPWQMFYMACYNIDRFKMFVKESPFLKRLKIPQERWQRIKENETELLKFAFDWVRFAILGEPIFEIQK